VKDWRGVILEVAIIAAMVYALTVDHTLSVAVVTALAAWGGALVQRSKLDALAGMTIYPPAGGQGGGGGGMSIRVPPYPVPNLDTPDSKRGASEAPKSEPRSQGKSDMNGPPPSLDASP
jgi:hypothetical protein